MNKLGIFDQVKPKVIYATNVSQALEYVSTGEVDAAIIFATEAKAGGDKVKVVATADPSWYTPVAYPIGIVTASKAKTLGQVVHRLRHGTRRPVDPPEVRIPAGAVSILQAPPPGLILPTV